MLKQYNQIKNTGVSLDCRGGVSLLRRSGVNLNCSGGVSLTGISIEGREWSTTKQFDPVTGITKITNTAKIKVVDKSYIIKDSNKDAFVAAIKTQFESSFTYADTENKTFYSANFEHEFVEETCYREEVGIYMELIDDTYSTLTPQNNVAMVGINGKVEVIGDETLDGTQNNLIKVKIGKTNEYLDGSILSSYAQGNNFEESLSLTAKTACHELGHTAGLRHPFDPLNSICDIDNFTTNCRTVDNNIMNSADNEICPQLNPGRNTTLGQQEKMTETILSQTK